MKKPITILIFMLGMSVLSQNNYSKREYDIFASAGIDLKMATVGPYDEGSVEDIGTTLNMEFKVGVEHEKTHRIWMGYEIHPAIGYTKWTYIAVDYKIANAYIPFTDFQLKNFTIFAGIELANIRRTRVDRFPLIDDFRFGLNFELMYSIKNTPISFGLNFNIFQNEIRYKKIDSFRQDVMFNIYYRI